MPLDLTVPAVKNATKRAHYLRLLNNILAVQAEHFPVQAFRGLALRTHPDANVAATRVLLEAADEIVMQDGSRIGPWENLVADISTTGAGGRLSGNEEVSRWYRIYALRKSSDGTKALALLIANTLGMSPTYVTGDDTSAPVNSASSDQQRAQSFQASFSTPISYVDLLLVRSATSPGGTFTVSLLGDSGGLPNLADVKAVSDGHATVGLSTTAAWYRIPFRTPFLATSGSTYHIAVSVSYAAGANNIAWRRDDSSPTYANGYASVYNGTSWTAQPTTDFLFRVGIMVSYTDTADAVASFLPTGYDQYAHIGWVFNASDGHFRRFAQIDRHVACGVTSLGAVSAAYPILIDIDDFVPYGAVEIDLVVNSEVAAAKWGVAGVPDGIEGATGGGVWPSIQSSAALGSETTPIAQLLFNGVRTHYQGCYVWKQNGGAGNGTPYIRGFKW
jgi:hypothetical protein